MDRDRILQFVRDFAALHGQDISEKLFVNLSGVTALEIAEHFSNWKNLRAAAGLAATDAAAARITQEDIVEALQKVLKKHGPRLTLQTFCAEAGISETMIYKRCGSWTRLRVDAGLPPRANTRQPAPVQPKHDRSRKRITAEQILDRLRLEVRQHGENMSLNRFCRLTAFSTRLIFDRFGSWSNLRRAAGLSPYAVIVPRFTREQLLDDLLQVYERRGGDPRMARYRCDGGRISTVTICARFGSWPQAIAALHAHRLSAGLK